jgi:hypothetical protein
MRNGTAVIPSMATILLDFHWLLKSSTSRCIASQHVSLEFQCLVPGFLHDQSHRECHFSVHAVSDNLQLLRGVPDYHLMIQEALRSSRLHDRYAAMLLPMQHIAIDATLQVQVCQDGWQKAIRVDARV